MSNPQTKQENTSPPPPPPRELPSSKISPLVRKLRTAPPSTFFQTFNPPPRVDLLAAPTGPYFFYGTLADPSMLRDILELDSEPELRPAYLIGYECKLWGQYPALLDAPGLEVKGAVYNVRTVEEGERLAEYETNHYRAESCHIRYTDEEEPAEDYGYTFKFVGDRRDLSEGVFDLELWLRRMGRLPRTTSQAAQHYTLHMRTSHAILPTNASGNSINFNMLANQGTCNIADTSRPRDIESIESLPLTISTHPTITMTTPTSHPQTWTKGDYLISTDISLISLPKLNAWFASDDLYWASPLPLDALQQTIQSSLCFGLYHNPPQQDDSLDFIGIARCVTDYTTFVYITDVYVDASHRGNGLGSWLVECVGEVTDAMPHLRRSMLFTSDWMRSVPFYEKILGMSVQESKIGEGMAMMMRKGRGYPQYRN